MEGDKVLCDVVSAAVSVTVVAIVLLRLKNGITENVIHFGWGLCSKGKVKVVQLLFLFTVTVN